MKIAPLLFLKKFFGAESAVSTQSSSINGDGNTVDQSVTNYYVTNGDGESARSLVDGKENDLSDVQPLAQGGLPSTRRRTLNIETFTRAARHTEQPVTVFLAGPYIEPEKENMSRGSAASTLRFELFHRLRGENFVVSLGTYSELRDSFKTGTGGYNNAAEAELNHAKDVASLVVMIPDSPGSFAEIGAFSLKTEICTKMMILADVTHEESLGYLNTGPVACAKALGSKVKHVDYNDVEGCFKIVKAFSNSVKTRIQLEARLRG